MPRPALGSRSFAVPVRWVTAVIVALLVWLPLSTPIAVLAYQYLGLGAQATRWLLVLKDAAAAALLAVMLFAYGKRMAWRWFDLAAVAFIALVGLYTIASLVHGSPVGTMGIIASAREFSIPAILYLLGRLAHQAGVDPRRTALALIGIGIAVACVTLAQHYLVPTSFLATTYDLVAFIRNVQGFATAKNLWDISILGMYNGVQSTEFARAVGPFTHPVGTAHYLVLPLAIVVAYGFDRRSEHPRWAALGALVLGIAILLTISRGSWIAAGLAILLAGATLRRLRLAMAGLAVAAAFIFVVPSLRLSVTSALSLQDTSARGHIEAIVNNVGTFIENPFGAGMGRADKFGTVDQGPQQGSSGGGGDSGSGGADPSLTEGLGVSENTYLSLVINVGPLGLLAFLAWVLGVLAWLIRSYRISRDWVTLGVAVALIGYLASAFTSSPLMRFTTSGSVWLVLGLVVASTVRSAAGRATAVTSELPPSPKG